MSDDWKPGDLACCISDDWWAERPCNPQLGDVLRISTMFAAGLKHAGADGHYFSFVGKPPRVWWHSSHFLRAETYPVVARGEDVVSRIRNSAARQGVC